MYKLRSGLQGLGAALALTAMVGCSSDDLKYAPEEQLEFNAFNAINANSDNTSLYRAIVSASGELETTLSGPGQFTVFAPNDDAFEALAGSMGYDNAKVMIQGAGDTAPVSPEVLATILNYHVIEGSTSLSSLNDAQEIATVLGEAITVSVDDGVFLMDKTERPETSTAAKVVSADLEVTNGLVHTIDKVLLPQTIIDAGMVDTRPTILELAVAKENLATLESAAEKVGLVDILSSKNVTEEGNELGYTVFAPTNDAFADLLEFLGDDYESLDDFDNAVEIQLLADILSYHVIPQRLEGGSIEVGDLETNLEDASLEIVAVSNNEIEIKDASGAIGTSETLDIQGSNGVVHVIDRILLPQAALDFVARLGAPDLADIVSTENTMGILHGALVKTEMIDLFVDDVNEKVEENGASNFTYYQTATVFAPTNAAFDSFFDLLGDDYNSLEDFDTEKEIALLKNVLLYHVVPGSVLKADLTDGTTLATQAADEIKVLQELGTHTVLLQDVTTNSDTQLLSAETMARNGVVHNIDDVLITSEALDFIESLNDPEE